MIDVAATDDIKQPPLSVARRAATFAMFTAGAMIAQQVAAKAVRDALFLSHHPVRELPNVMIAAAVASLVAVLAMTRGTSRLGPTRAVSVAFGIGAVLFFVEWLLLPSHAGMISVVAYLHIAALGGVTLSGFWSLVTERFDPRTAKRVIGRINTGGAIGGLVGGLVVNRSATWSIDIRTMLLWLAVANACGGLLVLAVAGAGHVPAPGVIKKGGLGSFDGLRLVKEMPYLRLLGLLIALTGAAAALSDFAFKSVVATHQMGGEAMAGFFAIFYGGASLATLIVQAAFAKRALARLGLALTIALLPGAFVIAGVVGVLFTRLATLSALRGVETTLSHSLFRSAYELFYTPLAPEKKRPTKAIIDVGFDRAGDTTASVIVLIVAALVTPTHAIPIAIGIAVVLSAVALWVCLRLHDGYVSALGDELRSHTLKLSDEEVVDATTRNTLRGSELSMDRETLLREIEKLRHARANPPKQPAAVEAKEALAPLLARLSDLFSDDLECSRRALAATVEPKLVPFVLILAARRELREDALDTLRRLHVRAAGQIADALLDPATPRGVRKSLPPLLALTGDQRALDALVDGLFDAHFEVRVRCARAMTTVRERSPELLLPRSRLIDVAILEMNALGDSNDGAPSKVRDVVLAHVFEVLALALGERALWLAWKALSTSDERIRGTALEYLDNILPEAVRVRLWPHLNDRRSRRPPPRSHDNIERELRASMTTLHPASSAPHVYADKPRPTIETESVAEDCATSSKSSLSASTRLSSS